VPFKRLLTELVETVPGASGAILADWEGEAVEQHTSGDAFEMKVTAAHWGIVLNRLRELHGKYQAGLVKESVLSSDEQHVIVGAIGDEYTLVMTMNRNSLPLVALRSFRETAELLKKEIY
jgi:predicted regulator of Ras-like GTPase activity (Roadblock/LC7/MglB family)